MKVRLHLQKEGAALYDGTYDVCDAASFGRAFADVWNRLRERRLATASCIGALFDELDEQLLDELYGSNISLSKP